MPFLFTLDQFFTNKSFLKVKISISILTRMSYVPPSQYGKVENDNPLALKTNPKYIQLQRVESSLKEFSLLKYYISFVLLYCFAKLIIDLCKISGSSLDRNVDIAIRIIQILGYSYGLQAHTSKVAWQWRVFMWYMIFSFIIIGYCTYLAIRDDSKLNIVLDVINIPLNIFLLLVCRKFGTFINKRDKLKKELQSEESFDEEKGALKA